MEKFERTLIGLYRAEGKRWLETLPARIQKIAVLWELEDLDPFPNPSYHYIVGAMRKGHPVLLKLGLDGASLKKEAKALKAFSGQGAVQVCAQTDDALLLARVVPGFSLKSYFPNRETKSLKIVARVIQSLHKAPFPSPEHFPSLEEVLTPLDKSWEIPATYLEKARVLRAHLLATAPAPVMLHGDLHHDNILAADPEGTTWQVIDPHGFRGDPTYEAGAFLRNPMVELACLADAPHILRNRVETLGDLLNIDKHRLSQWGFVQAVLAWIWALEDGCDLFPFKRLTELLDKIIVG